MFFIFGVNQEQKEIGSFGPVICGVCGRYGRYQVYMTYMCLSLFFIPVLKWGRKYYAELSCCQSLYEVSLDAGRRLLRGEQTEIRTEDLTLIRRGGSAYSGYGSGGQSQESQGWGNWGWEEQAGRRTRRRYCPSCGYETEEEFEYCPKCGRRLEEGP